MKQLYLLAIFTLLLCSCGGAKKVTKTKTSSRVERTSSNKKVSNIISHAKSFQGTRYKFGGTTSKGMDCSGLVYVAFNKENISLPRVSRDMAKRGKRISLSNASKGDLVFFQTNKNSKTINHVGLVVNLKGGTIQFIHSTSSRGVIISSLDERYWKGAFIEVRRVI